MTTTNTDLDKKTWGDLLQLPVAPSDSGQNPSTRHLEGVPRNDFSARRGGLEMVWKPSGNPVSILRGIVDPGTARKALGVSQSVMGRLLADYLGRPRPYTKSAVSAFEFGGKATSAKARLKWGPPAAVVEAYRLIICDAVALLESGRYTVRAHMGKRAWRFEALALCRRCARRYVATTPRSVNCPRCCRQKAGGK